MSIPARIAAAGTIVINVLSFALSFYALTDIARRAHVAVPVAWPLIVDGLIIVATVAVVALRGSVYAWVLLVAGASVSVAGNVLHAVYPEGPIPVEVAAFLAVVPPVALVAVTHLTVHLARHAAPLTFPDITAHDLPDANWVEQAPEEYVEGFAPKQTEPTTTEPVAIAGPGAEPVPEPSHTDPRELAEKLIRETTSSNYAIADQVGVSEATVRRWRKVMAQLR
ncbi:DUF2637 domain-containing protein [Nocardia wallacei]|uniref:DUF2637 domain-containing protein n=1 Tax=Nocardia wallacei TaxID=480035 RepID=UPI00245543E5|nr:DUF2637 domain-containing protein [Nocardia wallacei]